MFAEFMKEELIKSAKLNSLSPPFLSLKEETLALHVDNGVIISHTARPAARAISTLFMTHQQPMSSLVSSEQTPVLHVFHPTPSQAGFGAYCLSLVPLSMSVLCSASNITPTAYRQGGSLLAFPKHQLDTKCSAFKCPDG